MALYETDRSQGSQTTLPSIRKFINDCLGAHPSLAPGPADSMFAGDLRKKKPVCFLQHAKNTLPQSRLHVTTLIDPGGRACSSPADLAKELKRAWSPIWAPAAADARSSARYLRDKFPQSTLRLPPLLTVQHMRAAVLSSGKTSAGPDGIPFLAYKVFEDIATPLLYAVFCHLAHGGRPNRSFNFSLLFFLPKEAGTTAALKHRPIAVSNTDNRIIAHCVKTALALGSKHLVSCKQHAFLRGRSIEDCIRLFNERFFSAKERGEEFYVLLVDFAKAFDSVSRDYLFLLLRQLKAPEWLVNVLKGLYTNVKAQPVTGGTHNITIAMLDGLKQGCPLSPLLFILVIDPLLQDLHANASEDHSGFADDVAVGLRDLARQLPSIVQRLDAFTEASGIRTNPGKSVLIPAHTSTPTSLSSLPLPPVWSSLRISHHERYLGTYLGRDVTVHSVWDKALSTIRARVALYMPRKKAFTIQGRIDIANVFLVSIMSYLMRFYFITSEYEAAIEQAISRWVIPYKMCKYDDLTLAPAEGGFSRPLRALMPLNDAILLRKCPLVPYTVPLDESTMRTSVRPPKGGLPLRILDRGGLPPGPDTETSRKRTTRRDAHS